MFKIVRCAVFAVGVSLATVSVEAGFGDLLKAVTGPDTNNQQQEVVQKNENACPQCNGQGYVTQGFKAKKCKACGGTGIVLQLPNASAATASTVETETEAVCDDISMDELKRHLGANKGCLLLDVREPGEFSSGHIKGAVNVPVGQISSRIATVCGDKTRDIYVYCQSGRRSRTAAQMLVGMGYKKVHNVLGGVSAWNGKLVQ